MTAEKITATLKNQPCPVCGQKKLILTEAETEVPFFGKLYIFSMTCENCKYHKADVEAAEKKEPCRYVFEVSGKDDLKVRVVRSSEATVKFERVGTIEPGPAAEGFVTNIEGLINKIKEQIEKVRDFEEDDEAKQKAKNLLKKLMKVLWGEEKLKITIEDPSGNSAIISEKAKRSKL
ncbi:MAG: ZPR1 zinc finger domain-containing protein [Candidatus Woesearchaeota archaeon]